MTLAFGASYTASKKTTLGARFGYVNSPAASNYWVQTSTGVQSSSVLPNQQQKRGEISFDHKMNQFFNPKITAYIYDTAHGITTYSATCTNPSGTKNQSSWLDASGNEQICVASAGEIITAGTEVAFSGRITKQLNYNTGYSYLASDNTTNNAGMSHNFVNAGLNFREKRYFGNFTMIYVGPRSKTTSPLGTIYYELGNYTRYDLNGGMDFKVRRAPMTFTVFGRNLGDSNYATRYVTGAYRDPGRTVGVQLAGKVF